MKIKRNLSGIYFRVKKGKIYDNVVFEDLTEEQQDEQLKDRDSFWVKALAKQLANVINDISKQFDIKRM